MTAEWDDLVRAALIGSQARRAVEHLPADLLPAVAARAPYERAGRLPKPAPVPAPAPAPDDDLPRASSLVLTLLSLEHGADLLREWLSLAAAAHVRAPDAALPALLDRGRARIALRRQILPILGARGRWLAAQNDAWRWAAAASAASPDETWQTGTRATRLALLDDLRSSSDPAAARALVESTWREDGGDDRAAFLAALEPKLSMADEPFLEAALDDRRREVRTAAAELLSRLPDSRLAARMTARAREFVKLPKLTLPVSFDDAWSRDGLIEPAPKGLTLGAKAWWLQQLLARTPPRTWGMSAINLVASARGEWEILLLGAWCAAAQRFADVDLAEALVVAGLAGARGVDLSIASLLPAPRAEHLVRRILPEMGILEHLSHTLSPELSRAALDAVRRAGGGLDELRARVYPFADKLSPELAAELLPIGAQPSAWGRVISEILPTLELRAAMHREFSQKGSHS